LPGQRDDSNKRRTAYLQAMEKFPFELYGEDIANKMGIATEALT